MAKTIRDLLREGTEVMKADYGPLSGTPLQLSLLRDALENPDMTVQEFRATQEPDTDDDEYTKPYIQQVLRRATEEFADENGLGDEYRRVSNGEETAQERPGYVETMGDTVPEPTPDIAFQIEGKGPMIPVTSHEKCGVCGEKHTVTYIVPVEDSSYITPPECGHYRVDDEIDPEKRRFLERAVRIFREKVDLTDDNGDVEQVPMQARLPADERAEE